MTDDAAAADTFDVVVIGGGPPGEVAAQYAIQGSDRTAAIVESELLGGECSFWACIPSKAMLRPIEMLDAAKAVPGAAGAVTGALDVPAVLGRRDDFTHRHDDTSQVEWAEGTGIAVVRGHGRLAGERAVEVTASDGSTRTLHARHAVVVATGTSATVPDVPGLRAALPWTSRDVTNLHEVPRRVLVLGGGVVACEAITWLHGLGAEELTVVQRAPSLLAGLEPIAGELVEARFRAAGVTVCTEAGLASVERADARDTGTGRVHGGPVTATLADGRVVEVDEVLVAAGRTPRAADLGLDRVGVAPNDHGYLDTDDHLSVIGGGGWLYAVGDICGRALLTHMGKYQGRVAGDVIAARAEGRPTNGREHRDLADAVAVPSVVFSQPQVASVGRTEAAARAAGIDVEVLEHDLAGVAGASLLRDDYAGRAKLVVDRATDTLVGATFVGPEVAELVHAATIAVVGRVPLDLLWHAVPSFPTLSEIWLRLLEERR
ncbi:MAG TPA: NAD(P)/FAD-dependent oxidoreductase [Aquihabitans sp.]|nr:NAD(P)/FAD-dependent oxidoreductase [Aquihabitans sp.]